MSDDSAENGSSLGESDDAETISSSTHSFATATTEEYHPGSSQESFIADSQASTLPNSDPPGSFATLSNSSQENVQQPMDTEPLEGQVFEVPLVNVVQEAVVMVSQSEENRENRERTPLSCSPNDNVIKRVKSSSKKRKRPNRIESDIEDLEDDDGLTCPICLDHWEMTGSHRLVSLKCGHLFGDSCLRRWLRECAAGNKSCPHCKTKAGPRDIRYLYARKMCIVDNSEVVRLQKELDGERQKVSSLQMELQMSKMENQIQQKLVVELQKQIAEAQYAAYATNIKLQKARTGTYKLFLEKTIDISAQAGCRVLTYNRNRRFLLASQKTSNNLFPGYGVRYIDATTLRPMNYLHQSASSLRDLCFDADESLFIAACSEKTSKLYDFNTKNLVESFQPSENSQIWSCGFDKVRTKLLYLGMQNGSTFVYDIRQPRAVLKEFSTPGDFSPVINVWSVPVSNDFPYGGCLVCKLTSCWFFEYTADQNTIPMRLNIDGPFVSMQYDANSSHILINARPSANHERARHMLADLVRLNESMATLQIVQEYHGSKVQSFISRSSQVSYRDTTIVTAYCEDQKVIQTWGRNVESTRTAISERILDTCPVYIDNETTYVAALTESKCRAYKFTDSS
ncbi:E3 ubiquitin-protein ligase RFWD3-like [Culicoides brevitarsis]|uniref:E3 ubiquitin-protein ligase RFWD3-like n=1 Tax=Culicoides brevitarsis TaxID=469753 RepID=UPI00307C2A44